MGISSIAAQACLLLISLAALAGSAAEIAVESDFEARQAFCRFFLCDETIVAHYAYKQQIQGEVSSIKTAVRTLRGIVLREPASAERWIDLGEALEAAGS